MTDLEKLSKNKERILSTLRISGPSLPIQIARAISASTLFASAFLSELKGEQKLKVSHMKVGSSSLYFLSGQEERLETFIQHLNQREREAFLILKNSKILEDDKQTPVIRVALRAIKDFAIPITVRINNTTKIFWKFHSISDEKAKEIISESLNITSEEKPKPIPEKPSLPTPIEEKETEVEKQIEEIEEKVKEETQQQILPLSAPLKKTEEKGKKKGKKDKKPQESEFANKIKNYLSSKDIELLESILEKKTEFTGKVRIDSLFGKQEYLLIAKDKKKLTEEDITLAFHKAQLEKMPALLLSPGEIDKKSLEHARLWRNLVKFEKIK